MEENTAMKDRFITALKNFGLPRLIITGFLVLLLVLAPFVGADPRRSRTSSTASAGTGSWSSPWSPWCIPAAA